MVKELQCRRCGEPISATYNLNHLCDHCSEAIAFVERRNRSSRLLGLQGDLTADQWESTVLHFNNLCAYCQKRTWDLIEHFMPAMLGGGMTASNVVPACRSCNSYKYNLHPDQVAGIPRKDIERVRDFLESQKLVPNSSFPY